MIVKTKRLNIVPVTMEHLLPLHSLLSDRELTRLMVFNPKEDLKETEDLIKASTSESQKPNPLFSEFAVLRGDVFVGNLTLYFFRDDPFTAEFAWVISPEHARKGYAFEAATALMDHYNREKNVTRFIAQCDSENHASIGLIEKLGMKFSGASRGRYNRSDPQTERTEYTYELLIR